MLIWYISHCLPRFCASQVVQDFFQQQYCFTFLNVFFFEKMSDSKSTMNGRNRPNLQIPEKISFFLVGFVCFPFLNLSKRSIVFSSSKVNMSSSICYASQGFLQHLRFLRRRGIGSQRWRVAAWGALAIHH